MTESWLRCPDYAVAGILGIAVTGTLCYEDIAAISLPCLSLHAMNPINFLLNLNFLFIHSLNQNGADRL